MSESLILFTIGPVQRFIETARKTEDLWMGSYILSYLNGIAMQTLTGNFLREDVELIFPSIENQPLIKFFKREELDDNEQEKLKLPTLPNRFLAKSSAVSTSDVEQAEQDVQAEFKRLAEKVFNSAFGGNWRGTHAEMLFKRQIEDFLEIYWLIHPVIESSYQEAYCNLEKELGGVKNCRWFKQIAEESRKCSLCGEREVIHFREFANEHMGKMKKEIAQDWEQKWNQDLQKQKYLQPDEYLCAICLAKRMGALYFEKQLGIDVKGGFPSTSEVSTAAFKLQIVRENRLLDTYKSFVNQVKNVIPNIPYIKPLPKITSLPQGNNIDGEWLFEETLTERHISRYYGEISSENRNELVEEQKNLKKVERKPSKYYAVVVMDGDSMGKKLSAMQTSEEHSDFSRRLSDYIPKVQRIIETEGLGKLLYAGGDDLLALTNLQDLLQILKTLRSKFPNLRDIPSLKDMSSSTSFGASVGVCIAHYKIPIGEVLAWARKMEKEAKRGYGKDAVGIALLKHSGNIGKTVFKWEYSKFKTIGLALKLCYALQKYLSNKFLYTFRAEFERMMDENFDNREILQAELSRLFHRHLLKQKLSQAQAEERKQLIDELPEQLATLLRVIAPKLGKGFDKFIGFLEICNFISKEADYETLPETD